MPHISPLFDILKLVLFLTKDLYGTFVHGLFDNDALRYKLFSQIDSNYKGYNFKEFKANAIKEFAQHIDNHINMDKIQKAL